MDSESNYIFVLKIELGVFPADKQKDQLTNQEYEDNEANIAPAEDVDPKTESTISYRIWL